MLHTWWLKGQVPTGQQSALHCTVRQGSVLHCTTIQCSVVHSIANTLHCFVSMCTVVNSPVTMEVSTKVHNLKGEIISWMRNVILGKEKKKKQLSHKKTLTW